MQLLVLVVMPEVEVMVETVVESVLVVQVEMEEVQEQGQEQFLREDYLLLVFLVLVLHKNLMREQVILKPQHQTAEELYRVHEEDTGEIKDIVLVRT